MRFKKYSVHLIVIISFICVIIVPASFADSEQFAERWKQTINLVRDDFPTVNQLSTRQLSQWLDEGKEVLLLDTREPEEFKISHLKNAHLATSARDALKVIEQTSEDSTIVLYCSVGYRSSKIAERLEKRGFKNVYNLEGSLFQWANEGRPVYRGIQPTKTVHPYDDEWGQLLEKEYWPHKY